MENTRKEYSEQASEDKDRMAAEYGNEPQRMNSDNSGDADLQRNNPSYPDNQTTGSGYIEAEREVNDSTNSQNPANADKVNNGAQELVDKYNINDKAYSDSSKDDFVETVSKFHHADENNETSDDDNIQI